MLCHCIYIKYIVNQHKMATSRLPTVPEYYTDKNIFITGATGYIGKACIEKLLRSCPDVGGIYCLIRPKKGQSAQERLTTMLNTKLFEAVAKDHPNYRDKVHAIHGDILLEELGLKDCDKKIIKEKINIVYHSAATVRFDEPIRYAMEMNCVAVRRMLNIFKSCRNVEAFVHVSTAYSNCNKEYIEELIYTPPVLPDRVLDALDWMSDEMVNQVESKMLGDMPNTYTYSKRLGEHILVHECGDMPVCIIRPSIVTAAWKEPFPGWVDNLNGPSGLFIATGKGFLRSMMGEPNAIADLVPLDLPVNAIIAGGWYTAVEKRKHLIYHVTTGSQNPFTWGGVETSVGMYFKQNPLNEVYRRPRARVFTPNSFMHESWVLISHLLPAYMADLSYMIMGKKPRVVKLYNRLHKATSTMEFFTSREWQWTHHNIDMLFNTLSPEDQKVFYLDSRSIDWQVFMEKCCLGAKTFLLKEDLASLPEARANLKRLRNLRYLFNTAMIVILWRLLIARSNLARNSWYFIMGLVFKFVRFFRITSTISQK